MSEQLSSVRELGKAFTTLLLRMVILSLVLAYLMAFIEGLKYYGMLPLVLPFSGIGQYQPHLITAVNKSPLEVAFDTFANLYNSQWFPGGSRWGTGVGMIGASFWTLHSYCQSDPKTRLILGIIIGALIGFRAGFLLSSSPNFLVFCMIAGAISIALYMFLRGGRPAIPDLPLVVQDS